MKRMLAGFLVLGLAMVVSVGVPGCTKKEDTKDLTKEKVKEKEKEKPSPVNEMTPKPKASTPKEGEIIEETPAKKDLKDLKKDVPSPLPPPIPLPPKEDPKKVDTKKEEPKLPPDLPKLDLPKNDPKKDDKGATLDRLQVPGRDPVLRAAFERRTAI